MIRILPSVIILKALKIHLLLFGFGSRMMGYGGYGFKTVFQQHHFQQDLYYYYNSAEIFAEKWKNITEYNLLSVFFEIKVKNIKFGDYSENQCLIPHPRNKTSTSLKLYLVT